MAESTDAVTETGAQPTSSQIRSEIERTRAEMDSTFDALERKMTPGQILEEAWHLTRGGTTAGASKLWQVAREHPLPATVIGLGLGWLLVESSRGNGRSSSPSSLGRGASSRRSNLYESGAGYGAYPESYNTDYVESWDSSQSSGLSDRVSSAAGSVKDAAVHAKDSLTGAASSAGHKVADVAGSVKERASDLGHLTRDKASELKDLTRTQSRRVQTGFWEMMEENPMAVGLSTLVLGVLAGLALPSTRKEDELLGETRDRLVDRMEEVGRDALDKGKEVAGTAVDTLKEEAQNAGLTPDALADKVREVGRHAKDAVKEEVKSQGLTGESDSGSQKSSTPGSQGATSGAGSGLTTGGVTTPSASTGGTTGTTGGAGGRTTPRETITPVNVNQSEPANKR